MDLIVDETHTGPSEASWQSWMNLVTVRPLEELRARRVLVVAPHPDDEVLGAGGLMQGTLQRGVPLELIAVTDGESSHPHSRTVKAHDLASLRRQESQVALQRLGWREPVVTRLGIPDGQVGQQNQKLYDALAHMLRPDDLCVAPWSSDGHPDHDACGRAAVEAARETGARSLGYLVWAWHWAGANDSDIPWDRCRRLDLSRRATALKRWSSSAFESQIRSLGPSEADAAILPAPVLRRFWRSYEIFVDEEVVA
jgi:LmbE family N-acetylglucosaminyl deacetylase